MRRVLAASEGHATPGALELPPRVPYTTEKGVAVGRTFEVRATGWKGLLLLAGVGLGLVALGWRARPTDAAIVAAIRSCASTNVTNANLAALQASGRKVPEAATGEAWGAELAAMREAKISLMAVDRNWLHELLGRSHSRFLVLAAIEAPGKPRTQGCFRVQPLGGGAAFAHGPYSRWHCYSPL